MSPEELSKAGTIPDMLDPEPSTPNTPPPSAIIPPARIPEPVIVVPPATPAPPQVINTAEPTPLKQIRTFQGDAAEALYHEQASLVSLRSAERAKQDLLRSKAEAPEDDGSGKRRAISLSLLIGGIIFLGAAGYAGYYAYTTYLVKTAVPVISIPKNRFLPVASTTTSDASSISRAALITLVQNEKAQPLADGNLLHIELTKGGLDTGVLMNTTELLLALEAKPPGSLVRAFDPLFMLGVLGGTPTSTFLLVKLDSYENAYAGMLDWEMTMKEDILPLFASEAEIGNVAANAVFTDATVKNKDARELLNASSTPVLVYSFYNQNLLIVTGSETALKTLLSELDTQALSR
ncbi:MAG: protein of unknown function with transrane region [Parcubacteria group bacterium]|nr:protein of unknown function with transrane region [Parcubacteria group bacterium]